MGSIGAAEPLPFGWSEYHNQDGIPYYHNASTGVTQWERPISSALLASSSIHNPHGRSSSPDIDPFTSLHVSQSPSVGMPSSVTSNVYAEEVVGRGVSSGSDGESINATISLAGGGGRATTSTNPVASGSAAKAKLMIDANDSAVTRSGHTTSRLSSSSSTGSTGVISLSAKSVGSIGLDGRLGAGSDDVKNVKSGSGMSGGDSAYPVSGGVLSGVIGSGEGGGVGSGSQLHAPTTSTTLLPELRGVWGTVPSVCCVCCSDVGKLRAYFDVTSHEVLHRCCLPLFPFYHLLPLLPDALTTRLMITPLRLRELTDQMAWYEQSLRYRPDFYVPFWISASLTFFLFASTTFTSMLTMETGKIGSDADGFEKAGSTFFFIDFTALPVAASMLYGFAFLLPLGIRLMIYLILSHFHTDRGNGANVEDGVDDWGGGRIAGSSDFNRGGGGLHNSGEKMRLAEEWWSNSGANSHFNRTPASDGHGTDRVNVGMGAAGELESGARSDTSSGAPLSLQYLICVLGYSLVPLLPVALFCPIFSLLAYLWKVFFFFSFLRWFTVLTGLWFSSFFIYKNVDPQLNLLFSIPTYRLIVLGTIGLPLCFIFFFCALFFTPGTYEQS